MLHGRGPLVILGLTTVGVDVLVIVNQDTASWGILAGLVIAAVATGEAFTVNPVGTVEVGVVQEAHGSKEVLTFAFVSAALFVEVT